MTIDAYKASIDNVELWCGNGGGYSLTFIYFKTQDHVPLNWLQLLIEIVGFGLSFKRL